MRCIRILSSLLALVPLASCHMPRGTGCNIPAGKNTVKLSLINPGGFRGTPPSVFLTPDINGTAMSDIPSYSALIEHTSAAGKKSKILFDLGLRADWENLPPVAVGAIKSFNTTIYSYGDPAVQLQKAGIKPESINSVIFSHSHFDHVGNMGLFPKSTSIIVGPGFKAAYLPGYPENPNSLLHQSDFDGREVKEYTFASNTLTIASLQAIDYFGDGSLYLISAPGHDFGHLVALARVTKGKKSDDDTFVLLAGDSTHHCGAFRPTLQRPLPRDIPRRQHLLDVHPQHSPYEPFYKPAPGGFNLNATEMVTTLGKLEQLDASPNVLTVIAHDHWLLDVVELFPKSANDWKKKGWADRSRWRFVNDFA